MKVNISWLRKYVDFDFDPSKLADLLTSVGLESNLTFDIGKLDNEIVVGEIKKVYKHPNADKLYVCLVDDGKGEYHVVCGAPNTRIGIKSAFARVGAKLPDGRKVKEVTIRGIKSSGILCAEDELGISNDHSGIIEFPADVDIGIPVKNIFEEIGIVVEIDLTPNRPDCTSHIGVAREISVITENKLKIPKVELKEGSKKITDEVGVKIVDTEGCPRYVARLIKGVKVAESPEWLKSYLRSVGIHPINNVVDAANFVMMETGQPLHTFDFDKLEGGKIVVRKAKSGEKVVTLEGKEVELNESVLLIYDSRKPVAIAGIVGLQNSKVDENTENILIESAYFNPLTIRRASKSIGISTEASYRFERGIDADGQIYAANRLAQLILEYAGGDLYEGIIDCNPVKIEPKEITLRYSKVNSIVGCEINKEWISKKLILLGCEILNKNESEIKILVPTFRPDLEREIDMIEEIVRIYGMVNIPPKLETVVYPIVEKNNRYELIERLREYLFSCGLIEVYSNSLISKSLLKVSFDETEGIRLKNPLSSDMAYLRTSLIPGLLKTAQLNIFRKNNNLRLFELGTVHKVSQSSEFGDEETLNFGILLTGNIREKSWLVGEEKSSLFHLKGILENILGYFGVKDVEYSYRNYQKGYFSHIIDVYYKSDKFVSIGELDRDYLNRIWDIQQPIYIMEGSVDFILQHSNFNIRYEQLPVFPAIERDLSIVVDKKVKVADVERVIRKYGTDLLKNVKFYDIYTGKSIEKGLKSFTFNIVFRSNERTLKDEEVDIIMEKIVDRLGKELNARLR